MIFSLQSFRQTVKLALDDYLFGAYTQNLLKDVSKPAFKLIEDPLIKGLLETGHKKMKPMCCLTVQL